MTLDQEIIIRVIKCIDISLIGIYYLIFGILASFIINKILYLIKTENIENTYIKKIILLLKIFLETSLIMISIYFIRIIIRRIPFPFNNIYGYNHSRVKEINGAVIMAFAILIFQKKYFNNINELFNLN